MQDTNLAEFYARVARFEKERSQGFGHEALGTLGRKATRVRSKSRKSFVFPLLLVGLGAFGLKGAILHSVGVEAYQSRVDRLNAGEGFDRLGGWLMQIDPVTAFAAEKIAAGKIAAEKIAAEKIPLKN